MFKGMLLSEIEVKQLLCTIKLSSGIFSEGEEQEVIYNQLETLLVEFTKSWLIYGLTLMNCFVKSVVIFNLFRQLFCRRSAKHLE